MNKFDLAKINLQIKKMEIEEKLNKIKEDILMIPIDDFIVNKLLGFQIQHAQNLIYALQRNGIATDQSDTGTGKTYSAVAICKQLGLRPLIVGPKSVIIPWYDVCHDFEVEPLGVVNYETLKNGKYYSDVNDFQLECREDCPYIEIIKVDSVNSLTGQPILTNGGRVKKVIQQINWKLPNNTLVIFDEAHKGKNGLCASKTSANSKLMVSIKSGLNPKKKIYGLFLSATMTDKMENLDVLLYIFGFYKPYLAKSYKAYLNTLGSGREEVLKKIHAMIFPLRGSRMRIDQLPAGIFKKNDVQAVTYPVSMEIAREIEEQHREIQIALANLRSKGESKGLGYIIRCWQKIEVLKSSTVAQEAIVHLRAGRSVVIFINFNETKKLLTEKLLEYRNELNQPIITMEQIDYIHGDQKGDERNEIVKKFKSDEFHVLICNIKAGGIGISLHDIHGNRQRVSLIFPTWSPIDLMQSLGRIYRANAKTDSIQRIVYCKPTEAPETVQTIQQSNIVQQTPEFVETGSYLTIEEKICANVNTKLENIALLNNDDMTGGIRI